MTLRLTRLLPALVLLSLPTLAPADLPDAYNTCVGCHGAEAQGNPDLNAPALAGLSATYLTRQLVNFKEGRRGAAEGDTGGASMAGIAASLSDADITALSDALAELPPRTKPATITGDVDRGKKLYNANCGDCHGINAEGNDAFSAPRLAGQHGRYLVDQFLKFKREQRGYHDQDRYGRQMVFMSSEIDSEAALNDLVAYLETLEVEAP